MAKLPGLEGVIMLDPKVSEAFEFAKALHSEVSYGKEGNMFDNQIDRTARILLDGINKAGEASPEDKATLVIIALLHKSFELGKTNAGSKMDKNERAGKEAEFAAAQIAEARKSFGGKVADALQELHDIEHGKRGDEKRDAQKEGAGSLSEFAAAVIMAEKAANIETSVHNPKKSEKMNDEWHANYIRKALQIANELPRGTTLTKAVYEETVEAYREALIMAPGLLKIPRANDPRGMTGEEYKEKKTGTNEVS